MLYGYKLVEDKKSKKCLITEKFTDSVIKMFDLKDLGKAKKLYNHLNLGGAFDGNTPPFFLTKIPNYINKATE